MPVRVAVFIDGANVYRAFKTVFGWTRYSPLQLAAGLAAGRHVVRTAFHIAAVPQEMGAEVYADQQRFLRRLRQQRELVVWTGRIAQADGMWHEKGVDVKIATDMVSLAYRDLYDAAILVSGDGDLAPAVQEIRRIGRIVENAIPRARRSWHLVRESSRYIPIDRGLSDRCRLPYEDRHGGASARYAQRDRSAEAQRY